MVGFRHTDTSNSVSAFQMSINRQLITFWLHQVPEKEEDFHTQVDALSISMNISRHEAKSGLRVGVMLRNFPKLLSCLQTHWHLDIPRLVILEKHLMAINKNLLPQVDSYLCEYFTPQVSGQVIPQKATLSKHIRNYIEGIDPPAAQRPQDQQQRTASFKRGLDGYTRLSVTMTDAEACVLQQALKKQPGAELIDSFMNLIDKKITTKVILNVFKGTDGLMRMVDGGIIDSSAIDATRVIDADAYTDSYHPTDEIRAAVQLLDGSCRYPNCTVSAQHCDIDHVINHDENGPTTPDNLACLCRFHHNFKTEQRVHYSIDENRVATWYFPNGVIKKSQPGGVKSPPRFGQSWKKHEEQRMRARRQANRS
ncbi:HNH endonuclease [Corynebacterium pseudotuberculosis 258]|uniref:HNH endonuclease n=1 Tax=Corynebacterium pseudotuberculosis 258 TaxID=1168865 RepID=A0AAU8PJL8_CORPS|nr:HNH endonuclease signature motif containing protein [Corynebacterium pseudotuberculosis]AEQ06011.1 HNH endonuclease [Corynebacterium pseudotuberculosis CIP 52.97]AFK16100.1 HNH endonuclease [Corynebacterium pseudotuberculosis 258]